MEFFFNTSFIVCIFAWVESMYTPAYINIDQSIVITDNPAYPSVIPGSHKTTSNGNTNTLGNQDTSDHLENLSNGVIMTANEAYVAQEPQQGKSGQSYAINIYLRQSNFD